MIASCCKQTSLKEALYTNPRHGSRELLSLFLISFFHSVFPRSIFLTTSQYPTDCV